jgi:hypothetical protein
LVENPLAQEGEGGSSVALTFDEFEPMNLPLDDAIALRERQGRLNRSQIPFNSFATLDAFSTRAAADLFEPDFQIRSCAFSRQFHKRLNQLISGFKGRMNLPDEGHLLLLLRVQFVAGADGEPDSLLSLARVEGTWRRSCPSWTVLS